jgi:hypothetical protein
MISEYLTKVTVSLNGNEEDCEVRAHVEVVHGLGMGGAFGAAIDGPTVIRINGEWVDIDEAPLGEGDAVIIEAALCEAALEDDRASCVDHDDYSQDCA